jgi:DNA-binding transcriptional LysR family regulator
MQLDQLRYFVAVAEELNFRRAAERLHVSQPPLSYHIKALETEFGIRLFDRTTREVSLTEAGTHLLEKARRILGLTDETKEDMRNIAAGGIGLLRIGFAMSASFHRFFYTSVYRYRKDFPAVKLTLTQGISRTQIDNLLTDRVDVGFLRWPVEQIEGLTVLPLSHDDLVMAMHRSHPQAAQERVSLSSFKDDPFICYPAKDSLGIGIYGKILQLCERAGFVPQIVQEALEPSVTIGLVAAGLGVAIVLSAVQCIRLPDVVFRPIADQHSQSSLFLAHRASESSRRVQAFKQVVLDCCEGPQRQWAADVRQR